MIFLKNRNKLESMKNAEQLEHGYSMLKPYSPFFYAIQNNMQGNIYLLIQKGFNQVNALQESIMQNKFNLFLSILDVVDKEAIKDYKNDEGMNLMHVFCEYLSQHHQDMTLINEVYDLLIDSGIDIFAKDKKGRTPLHLCFKNSNMVIANKLLKDIPVNEIVNILNTQDDEKVTVFGTLFEGLSQGTPFEPFAVLSHIYSLVGDLIKALNPFVVFRKQYFPYTQISYALEDGEMVHPLILLHDVNKSLDIRVAS